MVKCLLVELYKSNIASIIAQTQGHKIIIFLPVTWELYKDINSVTYLQTINTPIQHKLEVEFTVSGLFVVTL